MTVLHSVTNNGAFDVEIAPWALSVMAKDGVEVVPQTSRETGLLGNRILALWPYSNMSDDRVYWGKKYITVKQDRNAVCNFKFGSTNEDGYAAYFVNDCMFVKQYTHVTGGNYPDFGVSYETFTNNHFLEIESLGQLKTLSHGDSAYHTEVWRVIPNIACPGNDEDKIATTVLPYVKK